MAGEATEDRPLPPSERRRERARRSGDVAISPDLVAAGMLACAYAMWTVMDKAWWGRLLVYTRNAFHSASTPQLVERRVADALVAVVVALAWPLLLLFVGGLAVGLVQTRGWVLPARDGERSSRARFRGPPWRERCAQMAADCCKLAVLTAVAAGTVVPVVPALATLPRATAAQAAGALFALGERLAFRLIATMVALGLVDYVWRLARHRQRLRMTHEEARREHKETEGNPERKMERQRLHRELHSQAEPFDVGQARLLLVDPGRAAVAVAWTDGGEEPPVLIVRGEGLRARAIESVAHATGVPVTLDPALVRGLAGVSEGSAIPEVWYGALARARARGRGGGASRVTDARMAGSTAAPTPGGARG